MTFWPTVASNLIAGIGVALVASMLALLLTDHYAHQRELAQAQHARNLAAAEQFYSLYGEFFAAWKAWEFAKGTGIDHAQGPSSEENRAQLLQAAATVEGEYEALVVRLALEHALSLDDRAALWAMRFALKQLRYAVRNNAPLNWWRSDSGSVPSRHQGFRDYQAFKNLAGNVAAVLVDAEPRQRRPSSKARARALSDVTGNGDTILKDERFVNRIADERRQRTDRHVTLPTVWTWVVVSEVLAEDSD